MAAPRVVVGIGVGVAPGPGYAWHGGYWARPPYPRAYWVAPRYFSHRYYRGYWRR